MCVDWGAGGGRGGGQEGVVSLFCNYFKPLNLPTLKFCATSEEVGLPPFPMPRFQISAMIAVSNTELRFLTHSSE